MTTIEARMPQLLELNELQTVAYRFAIRFRAVNGRLPAAEELSAHLDIGLVDAAASLRKMLALGVVPGDG